MPYKDPEKARAYHAAYRKKKGESGYWRDFYRRNKQRRLAEQRRSHFMKSYGITPERYLEMADQQDGKCAICRRPERDLYPNGDLKNLSVDHDHETGKVRGLLCRPCNVGMGNLGDSAERLTAAARYLTEGGWSYE